MNNGSSPKDSLLSVHMNNYYQTSQEKKINRGWKPCVKNEKSYRGIFILYVAYRRRGSYVY